MTTPNYYVKNQTNTVGIFTIDVRQERKLTS